MAVRTLRGYRTEAGEAASILAGAPALILEASVLEDNYRCRAEARGAPFTGGDMEGAPSREGHLPLETGGAPSIGQVRDTHNLIAAPDRGRMRDDEFWVADLTGSCSSPSPCGGLCA